MPRGMSLHIGLNSVDPKHYNGWEGPLSLCENDARDMMKLAGEQSFESRSLLTKEATIANVMRAIRKASLELKHSDMFFLSYSGHGGQIRDESGDEPDKKDETWCLYDLELSDD